MRVIEHDENNFEEIDGGAGRAADSPESGSAAAAQEEGSPDSGEYTPLPYSDEAGEPASSSEMAVVDESAAGDAKDKPVDEDLLAKARGESADDAKGGRGEDGEPEVLPYSDDAAEDEGDSADSAVLDEIESPHVPPSPADEAVDGDGGDDAGPGDAMDYFDTPAVLVDPDPDGGEASDGDESPTGAGGGEDAGEGGQTAAQPDRDDDAETGSQVPTEPADAPAADDEIDAAVLKEAVLADDDVEPDGDGHPMGEIDPKDAPDAFDAHLGAACEVENVEAAEAADIKTDAVVAVPKLMSRPGEPGKRAPESKDEAGGYISMYDKYGYVLAQSTSRGRRRLGRQSRRYKRAKAGAVLSILAALAMAVALAFALVAYAANTVVDQWVEDAPSVNNIEAYASTGITNIYAADGKTVLGRIRTVDRIQVDSDQISQYVKDATVATEDARFYDHSGIDTYGIGRAFVSTLQGWQQGASTITQQLVRNTVLLDEMNDISIKRKVREMYLALKMEEQYSKDELLTLYLNIVNYGDGCYGVEAAANDYFDCHANELTLSQAALLAGIPQSPTRYNLRTNYDDALERREIVLYSMYNNNYITEAEYEEALADKPEIADVENIDDDISSIAPYFTDYVKEQLYSGNYISDNDFKRGFDVYTTLDVSKQEVANEAVSDIMGSYDGMDAALASVDPSNGDIVAMVGGRDYSTNKFNLATQMSRQAGSSFKTFTLVAALQEGVSPTSLYLPSNGPINIGNWKVDNDSGAKGGNCNLTTAFANSYNTVYGMLGHGIGPDKVAETARACGIESQLEPVDSISLGTQGINPLEMANAYATIANGGTHHDVVCITSIKDSEGNVLYEHAYGPGEKVLTDEVAQAAINVMTTVITSGTGTGARLSGGQPAAGKTGTSENGRDLWFVGFTPQLSTAVWTGSIDDSTSYLYGNTTSTPIWRNYMNGALAGSEVEDFPSDAGSPTYSDWSASDFTKDVS